MRGAHVTGLALMLFCIGVPQSFAQKRSKALEEFSKVCGVDVDRAADGVYAKGPHKPWQQFPNVKAVAKEHGREMAQWWHGEHGSLVQMANHDHSYIRYHEYCFDADGKLTRLTYETRARGEGWGYATTGTVNEDGHMAPMSSRFFGLRTGVTMPRPPAAEQADWVLHPKVYKRLDKLPFAKLMTTPAQPTTEQKKEDAQAH